MLGAFAVTVTPREEEPQINVTMANVIVPFPGASAKDVETLVATPAEQVIAQIQGLEHVYSVSKPGIAIITAEFKVGVPRTEALVRLYDTINANRDWLPKALNVGEPLIKPKGIDDVGIVTLTLWTADEARGAFDLEQVAHAIEVELKRVPGTREVTTIGGPGRVVRVLLDAQKLSSFGSDRRRSPAGAWRRQHGTPFRQARRRQPVDSGRNRSSFSRTRRKSPRSSSARPAAIRSTCPMWRASSTELRRRRATSGSAQERARRRRGSTGRANFPP